jgi:hypothetical protein
MMGTSKKIRGKEEVVSNYQLYNIIQQYCKLLHQKDYFLQIAKYFKIDLFNNFEGKMQESNF